jgi:phenylpropionate dioxygenase-like ring-hydroxylating dioxygenase large terminal subunit
MALPYEGENGLFSESWFPVCLASDVRAGQVIGRSFLDGRVVIYRGDDGAAHVLSAYCPHVGADLSCGSVVADRLRCAFHHWEYDARGMCVRTGVGDPAPKAARLFRFPVCERWGVIFAFNGREATWALPDFRFPDHELHLSVQVFPEIACDPWVICCNTPDVQHIKVLHRIRLREEGADAASYTSHSMSYALQGWHATGDPIHWRVGIHGTSLFFQEGEIDGAWVGVTTPLGLPRPGCTVVYMVIATHLGDGSPAALEKAARDADRFGKIEANVLFEDAPILQRIRFRPGTLTRNDERLAQFFEYLRRFPRSHHSAEFIK